MMRNNENRNRSLHLRSRYQQGRLGPRFLGAISFFLNSRRILRRRSQSSRLVSQLSRSAAPLRFTDGVRFDRIYGIRANVLAALVLLAAGYFDWQSIAALRAPEWSPASSDWRQLVFIHSTRGVRFVNERSIHAQAYLDVGSSHRRDSATRFPRICKSATRQDALPRKCLNAECGNEASPNLPRDESLLLYQLARSIRSCQVRYRLANGE